MKDVQVSAGIYAIEAKVDLVKQEMESINNHINRFKCQIDELSKKPDVPAEFNSLKSSIYDFIKDTENKHTSALSIINIIRATLENVKVTVSNQDNEIRLLRHSIPALDQKIDDAKEVFSDKIVSISTAFSNRFDSHADKQKKQLEEFSNFALSTPKSVLETNKSISEKIDIALLESSNAIAKMCNLEQTLKMLDRKLESLSIQIKKVELAQQV